MATTTVSTIAFQNLPTTTASLAEADLVAVINNSKTVRVPATSFADGFVTYTNDTSSTPGAGTHSLAWTTTGIFAFNGSQWRMAPFYGSHWEDASETTRFLLVNKSGQGLSAIEQSNARSNLGIAEATTTTAGLVKIAENFEDSGAVVTAAQVIEYVAGSASAAVMFSIVPSVSSLPATPASGYIYLVPNGDSTYTQYVWNTILRKYVVVGTSEISETSIVTYVSAQADDRDVPNAKAVYDFVLNTSNTYTASQNFAGGVAADSISVSGDAAAAPTTAGLWRNALSLQGTTPAITFLRSDGVRGTLSFAGEQLLLNGAALDTVSQRETAVTKAISDANAYADTKIVSAVSSTDYSHAPSGKAVADYVSRYAGSGSGGGGGGGNTNVIYRNQLPTTGEDNTVYISPGLANSYKDASTWLYSGGWVRAGIGQPASTITSGDTRRVPSCGAVYSFVTSLLSQGGDTGFVTNKDMESYALPKSSLMSYADYQADPSNKVRPVTAEVVTEAVDTVRAGGTVGRMVFSKGFEVEAGTNAEGGTIFHGKTIFSYANTQDSFSVYQTAKFYSGLAVNGTFSGQGAHFNSVSVSSLVESDQVSARQVAGTLFSGQALVENRANWNQGSFSWSSSSQVYSCVITADSSSSKNVYIAQASGTGSSRHVIFYSVESYSATNAMVIADMLPGTRLTVYPASTGMSYTAAWDGYVGGSTGSSVRVQMKLGYAGYWSSKAGPVEVTPMAGMIDASFSTSKLIGGGSGSPYSKLQVFSGGFSAQGPVTIDGSSGGSVTLRGGASIGGSSTSPVYLSGNVIVDPYYDGIRIHKFLCRSEAEFSGPLSVWGVVNFYDNALFSGIVEFGESAYFRGGLKAYSTINFSGNTRFSGQAYFYSTVVFSGSSSVTFSMLTYHYKSLYCRGYVDISNDTGISVIPQYISTLRVTSNFVEKFGENIGISWFYYYKAEKVGVGTTVNAGPILLQGNAINKVWNPERTDGLYPWIGYVGRYRYDELGTTTINVTVDSYSVPDSIERADTYVRSNLRESVVVIGDGYMESSVNHNRPDYWTTMDYCDPWSGGGLLSGTIINVLYTYSGVSKNEKDSFVVRDADRPVVLKFAWSYSGKPEVVYGLNVDRSGGANNGANSDKQYIVVNGGVYGFALDGGSIGVTSNKKQRFITANEGVDYFTVIASNDKQASSLKLTDDYFVSGGSTSFNVPAKGAAIFYVSRDGTTQKWKAISTGSIYSKYSTK